MGEIENIGNMEIGKYRIRFWNCKIDIVIYCIYQKYITNTGWTSIKLTYQKLTIRYFTIQNAIGAISRKYQIISVLSIVIRLIPIFTHSTDFWLLNKISWVFFLPMFSRSRNVTVSLHILLILDHWKARLWMLNQFKTYIMNVKSVQNWYYECWISSKPILWMLNRFKTDITNVESV